MKNARNGIAAAGNWVVDKLKVIDVWPSQDALANILAQSQANGGGPFNVLVDLARMRAPFPLFGIGLVGQDADGAWILERCREHGIEISRLQTCADAPTSYTDVMTVQGTGRRTFFHQRGANALLSPAHLRLENCPARIFHLAYLLLLDQMDQPDAEFGTVAARVLQGAQALGMLTSVDCVSEESERFARIVGPALPHTDLLTLNEFEAGRITGLPLRTAEGIDLDRVEEAAARLLGKGVRRWVVIHFPQGAFAAGADGQQHWTGSLDLPPGFIAGAVGAGDAFVAGLLYGFHEEEPMQRCLDYANCAAAACLSDVSTSGGLRPLEECLDLGRRYPASLLRAR